MVTARAQSLLNVFSMGQFSPAPVQREFQWSSRHAGVLLDDVLAAFAALGLDPGDGDTDGPGRSDGEDDDGDADRPSRGSPAAAIDDDENIEAEAVDDSEDGAEAEADNVTMAAALDETAARLRQLKVKGRGRRKPPSIYYLNGIVLLPAPVRDHYFEVYDGLQRITTLTIMVAKLRDSARSPGAAFREVADHLLYFDREAGLRRVLFPTRGATLAAIVGGRKPQSGELSPGDFKMREVANHFESRFAGWSQARREAFLGFVVERVIVTVQELDDVSLAYHTFVTANNRGLSLGVGDIIKGQLVEQASQRRATRDEIEKIEKAWNTARTRLHGGFNDFITALEDLKFGSQRAAAPGERMMSLFGEEVSPAEVTAWVDGEFRQLVGIFAMSREHLGTPAASGIDKRFRQLSFLDWSDWQPIFLAFGLGLSGGRSKAVFANQIGRLYRTCYKMELLGWRRERQKRCEKALEQLRAGQDPFVAETGAGHAGALHIPAWLNDAMQRNLRRPFPEDTRRGAFVRWLETLHWGRELPRSATDNASVEHVVPQSPTRTWAQSFSEEERDYWGNRLGNLCLLDREANVLIANASWDVKVQAFEKLRWRHRSVDSVLKHGEAGWTVAALKARTEALARRAARELHLFGKARK